MSLINVGLCDSPNTCRLIGLANGLWGHFSFPSSILDPTPLNTLTQCHQLCPCAIVTRCIINLDVSYMGFMWKVKYLFMAAQDIGAYQVFYCKKLKFLSFLKCLSWRKLHFHYYQHLFYKAVENNVGTFQVCYCTKLKCWLS